MYSIPYSVFQPFAFEDRSGRGLLHVACTSWSPPMIEFLLDVLFKDDLWSHVSAEDDHGCNVIHLLAKAPELDHWSCQMQMLSKDLQVALADVLPYDLPLAHMFHLLKQRLSKDELKSLVNHKDRSNKTPVLSLSRWQRAKLLIAAGADPHLALAELEDMTCLPAVDYLVQHSADVNATSGMRAAAHRLVEMGDVPLLKYWVTKGVDLALLDFEGRPLSHFTPHQPMLQYLLRQQADVNQVCTSTGDSLMHVLCRKGDNAMVKFVFEDLRAKPQKDFKDRSFLHAASSCGHVRVIKTLLQYGFDIEAKDAEGETPLHCACRGHHMNAVKCLVEHGANINSQDESMETPFFECVRSGSAFMVNLMLRLRADIFCRASNGNSALHLAAARGFLRLVKIIQKIDGFPISSLNAEGQSTLHLAVRFQHPVVVEELLPSSKDVLNLQDASGQSPLSLAAEADHLEIADILTEHAKAVGLQIDLNQPTVFAVQYSARNVLSLLVQLGVDLTSCVDIATGSTVLHLAAFQGDEHIAAFLLQTMNVYSVQMMLGSHDAENKTPFDIAFIQDNQRVALQFEKALTGTTLQKVTIDDETSGWTSRLFCTSCSLWPRSAKSST